MDYEKIGLKCGIEIHQRLDTPKLFCNCKSDMKDEEVILKVERFLRPSSGELGKMDQAVLYEYKKKNKFLYDCFENETCLVDLDEEPPGRVNDDALRISLSIVKHLKMFIPKEVHVMRKTVIDGSNTSGFQRTMIMGLGTHESVIKTSYGNVRVKDLELEEEASRIIERSEDAIKYKLNGQGIPLVEIGTEPDIKSPEQGFETAKAIGMLLRVTGRVKRGIGSIRQDVNISIKGGARVEIKGFQELKNLPLLIKNEVLRQESLIEIKKSIKNFDLEVVDATNDYADSDSRILKGKELINSIRIKGLGKGFLKKELCPGKSLGRELADFAVAFGTKGLIHSDEDMGKYGISLKSADNITTEILIAGNKRVVVNATNAVIERIKQLRKGVSEETRTANIDGTSSYARPLPGGSRMYPETDVAPIIISEELLKNIPKIKSLNEIKKDLIEKGLNEEQALEVINSGRLELFNNLSKYKDVLKLFKLLIEMPKELRSRFNADTESLSEDHFTELSKLDIPKEAMLDLMLELAKNPELNVKMIINKKGFEMIPEAELIRIIKKVVNDNKELVMKQKDHALKPLMGLVMKVIKGRAKGSKVMELLVKEVKRL